MPKVGFAKLDLAASVVSSVKVSKRRGQLEQADLK